MSAPAFPQEQQPYAGAQVPVQQQQQPYAAQPVNGVPAPVGAAPATNGHYDASATTAAHNGATPVKGSGPIDNNDVELWKQKFNAALANPNATIKSKSAADAREWDSGFCGCFSPIDACCLTYCCPCVVFGKTHHRLNKSASMQGYEPINTSCLMFFGASCFGLHWILEALQRSQIRAKYNLKGSFVTDIAAACCCVLCDLTQQEKETKLREAAGGAAAAGAGTAPEQYKAQEAGMAYEHKA